MTESDETNGKEWLNKLADPSNFEFMETPHGSQIHIVPTGLPESMLVRGGVVTGEYPDGSEKALCGVVSEFESADEVPHDVKGVMENVCTRCNSHAWRIRNKGKFEDIPL